MLVLAGAAASQTPAASKHHAVFELTAAQGPEWDLLFVHLDNLRAALRPDGGVEVAYEARLKQLIDAGANVSAVYSAA